MKKLIVLSIVALLSCMAAVAQESTYIAVDEAGYAPEPDPRLAGVWKRQYHVSGFAEYITSFKIDIYDGRLFISVKDDGTTDDGQHIKQYHEAKEIVVNFDGGISFNVYYKYNDWEEDERLYRTAYNHYDVTYNGGRINVKELSCYLTTDKRGHIIDKGETRLQPYTAYNINDNW